MDVLVNASGLNKGGAMQVAVSVVVESQADPQGITWHYALSREAADEVAGLGVQPDNVEIFDVSPSRSRAQRKRLKSFEDQVKPDAVFTVFGPTYVDFSAPHLLGVAACWVTHSTRLAYSTLPSITAKLRALISSVYRGWWFRFADRWVVEAENARSGMKRRLAIPSEKVDVVPNTCQRIFSEADVPSASFPSADQTIRLIYVSAYYPHKHLEFIPKVAAALKELAPSRRFQFVLTLPSPHDQKIAGEFERLNVSEYLDNVGRVAIHDLVKLYSDTDLCFMPSVLETFSASYVEAMATGRPIVASDLDFAHAVCQDAAAYFDPTDASHAARTVIDLVDNKERWQEHIARGKARLKTLPTAKGRYEMYLDSIRATINLAKDNTAVAERQL